MVVFRLSVGIGFAGYVRLLIEFTGAGLILVPLLGPGAALIGADSHSFGTVSLPPETDPLHAGDCVRGPAAAPGSGRVPGTALLLVPLPRPAAIPCSGQPLWRLPPALEHCHMPASRSCSHLVRPILWYPHPRLCRGAALPCAARVSAEQSQRDSQPFALARIHSHCMGFPSPQPRVPLLAAR